MKTIGTMQYAAIPIPAELEQVVARACRRGLWRRRIRTWAAGAAAVFALLATCANVTPLYASAAELPVLGQVVRVLRIGSGGTDGAGFILSARSGDGAVRLAFRTAKGQDAAVPRYSVVRRTAPQRVVLRLHGVETGELEPLLTAFSAQAAVADAYFAAVSDAGDVGVTVVLNPGYDCAVGEYGTPGELDVAFSQVEPAAEAVTYVLRSDAMPFGPALATLTNRLAWEGATQLRLPSGDYCVVLGDYPTAARAEAALAGLRAVRGGDLPLHVASGGPYDTPNN